MEELAALIEIYKSVDAAFSLINSLDHIEIAELIAATTELRRDPKERNQKKVEKDWTKLKEQLDLDAPLVVGDKTVSINELMSF